MKRMLKGLVFSSLILFGMSSMAGSSCCDDCCDTSCCDTCCDDCCDDCCDECCNICGCGSPCGFLPRPQSWNAPRELVGWQQFINKFEMDEWYGAFYITPQFTRSFKECRIAGFIFGEDYKSGKLTISGSRKTDRGANDWLADYFGLSPNFKSTVKFCPRVSNFILDFGMYWGFDNWWEGGFFRLSLPLVHTRWKLGMTEKVDATAATLGFDMGYMATDTVPLADLPKNFTAAIKGVTFGDAEALKYTKIDASCCERTKTRLADIHVELGGNFLHEEDYHMGLSIRAGFPAGNKRCCTYIFEPIVGNGGFFELGGSLTASARLWEADDAESSFWMYLDANVAHLFKKKLQRVFELDGKPNSRYMLVQELGSTVENLYVGETGGAATESTYQYQGKLMPLANLTQCCVDTSIGVMGEVALKFTYNWNNWSFDLGYNLWGRTGEKVCTGCSIPDKKYALKGDAWLYGWNNAAPNDTTEVSGLAATESKADIHAGTNTPIGTDYAPTHRNNPSIDTPALAWYAAAADEELLITEGVGTPATNQVKSSTTPEFLKSSMLKTGKTPSAISHKIFAHFSYAWKDDVEEEDEWIPFLGIGGEVEWAGKTDGLYATLSQWGIWLKGGLSFD